jgi:phosphonopyruvate decarboxylase
MPTVDATTFLRVLLDCGVRFFSGVPDTVLANLCFSIDAELSADSHILAANEGGAVAAAAGHYLATGRMAAVYLQNSGQGNAVNPLASLVSREVFGIPVLLLIGWRGEPGKPDEPEHALQGRITVPLLDLLGIPVEILPQDAEGAASCVRGLIDKGRASCGPVAAVIPAGTFGPARQQTDEGREGLTRERAIELIIASLPNDSVVVSTTGKASRELYESRERAGQGHSRDFLMVGSMGHASEIAHALALGRPEQRVICLDGDGAAIMHLGSLAVIGSSKPQNLCHVVLNNRVYDSVGGHRSAAAGLDFSTIAQCCGYACVGSAHDECELNQCLGEMLRRPGPALLDVRVLRGCRSDLGRPRTRPAENLSFFRRQFALAAPQSTVASAGNFKQVYERDGFIVARGLLPPDTIRDLEAWVDEVAALAGRDSSLHCYYEETEPELLRQIENFCPVHAKLCQFAVSDAIMSLVSQLLMQPAILFKDKINFKFPGGSGYEAHRDGRFWWTDSQGNRRQGWDVYASDFISVLVSIDPSNILNGCLELAAGKHDTGDLLGPYGPLTEEQAAAMDFQPCPTEPGDVIFFNALAPHRSGPNLSGKPRRTLYLTYHPRADGDWRERYFEDKRVSLARNGSKNR